MQIVSKIIWVLVIIITFLFVTYLASKIVAIVIRRNLGEISINMNTGNLQSTSSTTQSEVPDTEETSFEEEVIESFLSSGRKTFTTKSKNLVEGFDNSNKGFKPLDPTVFDDKGDICCLNHEKM